jgi:hypothetical protein
VRRKERLAPSGVEAEFAGGLTEEVAGYAGAALMVEVMRRGGLLAVADRVLPAEKNPRVWARARWWNRWWYTQRCADWGNSLQDMGAHPVAQPSSLLTLHKGGQLPHVDQSLK